MISLEQLLIDFFSVLSVSGVLKHFYSEKEMSRGSIGSKMLQGAVFIQNILNQRIQFYKLINVHTFSHITQQYTGYYNYLNQMKINEQERRKIDADERGNPVMTVKTIKYYCYKQYLFETPELNEKLYLHYKGFKKIQSLENYPNLVTIWLNNNCILKIEGLATLKNLICLYLNNNIISKIQNLEGLDKLSILHLAHNRIDKIEGLGSLKVLNILNVSENFLSSAQSILGLKDSNTLTSIDLSKNQLQNSNEVFDIISSLQNMTCINMKNTMLSKYHKNYRKKLTSHLKKLTFLDDRPVKVIDHRLAQAWMRGGPQFESQQRLKIAQEVKQKNIRENIQLNQRIKRQQMKNQEIKALEVQMKNIEEHSDNEQKEQYRKEIQRRLDILKDGPKGFQALITDTSIKILQVKEQEQSKIIDKYFFREKKKVEQNLKRVEKQKMSIKQANIGEDQNKIEKKIVQMLGLNKEKQEKTEKNCSQKWKKKYQPILEALLYKEKFNFETVAIQFNKIMKQVGQKTMKVSKKFQLRELEYIWTEIEDERKKEMELKEKMEKMDEERKNNGESSQYQDQDINI